MATWPDDYSSYLYHVIDARLKEFYREVFDRLLHAPAARAFLANSDLHDIREDDLYATMSRTVDALFWVFEKRPLVTADIPSGYREQSIYNLSDPLERWTRIVKMFPVRVETWFAIGPREMLRTRARLFWDACIPGAFYATRRIAQNAIRNEGLSVAPFRVVHKALRAAGRLSGLLAATTTPLRTSQMLIGSEHFTQRQFVARSAATFVCGSGAGYPVRKYLEVPAVRSALVAYPCVGFEDFGFKDGVNVAFTAPEDAGKTMRRLLSNDTVCRRMIDSSFNTVLRLHSVERRARETLECLRRLRAGSLGGAQFVDGKFEIYAQPSTVTDT